MLPGKFGDPLEVELVLFHIRWLGTCQRCSLLLRIGTTLLVGAILVGGILLISAILGKGIGFRKFGLNLIRGAQSRELTGPTKESLASPGRADSNIKRKRRGRAGSVEVRR